MTLIEKARLNRLNALKHIAHSDRRFQRTAVYSASFGKTVRSTALKNLF